MLHVEIPICEANYALTQGMGVNEPLLKMAMLEIAPRFLVQTRSSHENFGSLTPLT